MYNKRILNLGKQGSAIRELFEYGKKRKQLIGNDKVFDFSIGNPSVASPSIVKEKIIEILNDMDDLSIHGYTSSSGNINTRNAIASYLNETFSCAEQGKYIYLTHGAAAGLSISFNALLSKDDEVIIFAPFWPEYVVLLNQAKAKEVIVSSNDLFLPDFNDLKSKINEKTKMVIINSPNNPTGVIYDENTIIELSNILNEKQKEYGTTIYLLSDEPYRDLIYSDVKYPFITNYYDNCLVAYSFSKSLSLPGERIGYLLVGSKTKNVDDVYACIVGAGRALGFVCATSLFQNVIPYCLGHTSNLSVYKENRDLLYNKLISLGYQVTYPDGAFYLFVKALEDDDEHFSKVAKDYELLIVPSSSFGIKGYVRIAYCVSKETILNSFEAFEKLIKHYKGE